MWCFGFTCISLKRIQEIIFSLFFYRKEIPAFYTVYRQEGPLVKEVIKVRIMIFRLWKLVNFQISDFLMKVSQFSNFWFSNERSTVFICRFHKIYIFYYRWVCILIPFCLHFLCVMNNLKKYHNPFSAPPPIGPSLQDGERSVVDVRHECYAFSHPSATMAFSQQRRQPPIYK